MSKSRETPDIDFKKIIDVSKAKFPPIAKDIFAMSNNGGGYIIVGVGETEKGSLNKEGLPEDFHIDQADLQEKFNAYCKSPISLGYREFHHQVNGNLRKFAVIHAPPVGKILTPSSEGVVMNETKKKVVFSVGDVFIRRGTQSIKASPEEIELIREMCDRVDYEISLTSGNPDRINEVIYSNLFKVKKIPDRVFRAEIETKEIPFIVGVRVAFITHGDYVYSFSDPSSNNLKEYIVQETVMDVPINELISSSNNNNKLIWLLHATLGWVGRTKGMYYDWKKKRLFYPITDGSDARCESWPGLSKNTTRQVAAMMYVNQLGMKVGLHGAVSIHFTMVGDQLYLRILPTYIVTKDGKNILGGEGIGAFITHISHDDYNKAVLRNMLFFVAKLELSDGPIRFPTGILDIDHEPVNMKVGVGIKSDRPVLDSILTTPPDDGDTE